jgi:hypothetical protein
MQTKSDIDSEKYEYQFLFLMSRVKSSSNFKIPFKYSENLKNEEDEQANDHKSILFRGGLYDSNNRFDNFNETNNITWFYQYNENLKSIITTCNEICLKLHTDSIIKPLKIGNLSFVDGNSFLDIYVSTENYLSILSELISKKSFICTVYVELKNNQHLSYLKTIYDKSFSSTDENIKRRFMEECIKMDVVFSSADLNFK